MAIRVRCINCGKTANVRDELAGKKVKCTCGAAIAVPLPPQPKNCAGCGVDITRAKRIQDPHNGKIYCEVCWSAKLEAARVGASKNADDTLYYPCYVCDILCTADEVFDAGGGKTVCKKCWNAGKRPAGMEQAASGSA